MLKELHQLFHNLRIAADNWWEELNPVEQQEYIGDHPKTQKHLKPKLVPKQKRDSKEHTIKKLKNISSLLKNKLQKNEYPNTETEVEFNVSEKELADKFLQSIRKEDVYEQAGKMFVGVSEGGSIEGKGRLSGLTSLKDQDDIVIGFGQHLKKVGEHWVNFGNWLSGAGLIRRHIGGTEESHPEMENVVSQKYGHGEDGLKKSLEDIETNVPGVKKAFFKGGTARRRLMKYLTGKEPPGESTDLDLLILADKSFNEAEVAENMTTFFKRKGYVADMEVTKSMKEFAKDNDATLNEVLYDSKGKVTYSKEAKKAYQNKMWKPNIQELKIQSPQRILSRIRRIANKKEFKDWKDILGRPIADYKEEDGLDKLKEIYKAFGLNYDKIAEKLNSITNKWTKRKPLIKRNRRKPF